MYDLHTVTKVLTWNTPFACKPHCRRRCPYCHRKRGPISRLDAPPDDRHYTRFGCHVYQTLKKHNVCYKVVSLKFIWRIFLKYSTFCLFDVLAMTFIYWLCLHFPSYIFISKQILIWMFSNLILEGSILAWQLLTWVFVILWGRWHWKSPSPKTFPFYSFLSHCFFSTIRSEMLYNILVPSNIVERMSGNI